MDGNYGSCIWKNKLMIILFYLVDKDPRNQTVLVFSFDKVLDGQLLGSTTLLLLVEVLSAG